MTTETIVEEELSIDAGEEYNEEHVQPKTMSISNPFSITKPHSEYTDSTISNIINARRESKSSLYSSSFGYDVNNRIYSSMRQLQHSHLSFQHFKVNSQSTIDHHNNEEKKLSIFLKEKEKQMLQLQNVYNKLKKNHHNQMNIKLQSNDKLSLARNKNFIMKKMICNLMSNDDCKSNQDD